MSESLMSELSWDGHTTWYRVEGDLGGAKAPLILLHGGPGVPHDYLESMREVATRGRPVVFYDQLGCGRSEHLRDAPADFWTVDLFKRELAALIDHLGAGAGYHLYGQSWGGMLALEHALDHPSGLKSMILANSLASTKLWVKEADRPCADLPPDVQATLKKHEEAGTTDDDAYTEAMFVFYNKHLCRLDPYPEEVMRSFAGMMEDNTVYSTMWGPSEFTCTGDALKDWDVTDRLGEIDIPTLILSGRHDESTPAVNEPMRDRIAGSEWVVLEQSAHMSHVEEKERTHELVEDFLARVDASS